MKAILQQNAPELTLDQRQWISRISVDFLKNGPANVCPVANCWPSSRLGPWLAHYQVIFTHSLTHSPTHPPTHPPTHSLTHSLTHLALEILDLAC